MRYDDPTVRDMLAAEYVLGTLHGPARRRFEQLLQTDTRLRAQVRGWQHRLHGLDEALAPVQPPARVWRNIKAELGAVGTATLWDSLPFWRNLGMAAAALVLVLATLLSVPLLDTTTADQMVVVADRKSQPIWVISAAARDQFRIKTVKPAGMPPEKACVFWLVWKDGYAEPVGALPEQVGTITVAMPEGMTRNPHAAEVAVSVERVADMPMPRPKGDIIFRGPWVTL